MPIEHQVKQGESLLSIADKYGLLPDTIWNDPANSQIKTKRGDPDRVAPGDVVHVRDKVKRIESVTTGQNHRFRKKGGLGLVVRLDIDPNDTKSRDDRFVLSSTDSSYRSEKNIKDDLVPGDAYVDLHFSGLKSNKSYTFEVFLSKDQSSETVFEDVPYAELAALSSQVKSQNTPGDDLSDDGDAPYPDDSDQEEQDATTN